MRPTASIHIKMKPEGSRYFSMSRFKGLLHKNKSSNSQAKLEITLNLPYVSSYTMKTGRKYKLRLFECLGEVVNQDSTAFDRISCVPRTPNNPFSCGSWQLHLLVCLRLDCEPSEKEGGSCIHL